MSSYEIAPPGLEDEVPVSLSSSSTASSSASVAVGSSGSWTIYQLPDGRQYFYDALSQRTQWEMPPEVLWTEYAAPDGRAYYYNRQTGQTTWTRPAVLSQTTQTDDSQKQQQQQPTEELQKERDVQKQSEDQKEVPIKEDMILKAPLRVELEYTDPEEARKAFMELLHDKISNSGISWSEAMPLIVRDKRYGALKTIKERKAMFEAFLGDKKLMEKRGQEEKSRKAMEAYQLLVKDPWVSSQTRWSEFQTKFAGDARFTNVEDVGLKKKIFLDHVKGMERREKAEQAEKIKKGKEQFLSILKETSEMKWDSNWISIEKIIRSKAEKIGITEEDQVAVFDVLLKQLKDEHEAQERLKKDQQKKENKAARDDFRQLLRACKNSQTPTIYPSIRWKEFLPLIEKKEEFLKLNSLDRDMPKTLFEDYLDGLYESTYDDKKIVKRLVKNLNFEFSADTKFDELFNLLRDNEEFKKLSSTNSRIALMDVIYNGRQKFTKYMKKRDKYLASFRKLLKKKIKFDMRWEDAKILIDDYDIYHKLTRKDRVLTFVEHLDSLATKKSNGLNKANDLASDEDGAFEEDYARKDLKIVEVATKRKMTARSFSRSSSRSPSSERNKRRNRGYHL